MSPILKGRFSLKSRFNYFSTADNMLLMRIENSLKNEEFGEKTLFRLGSIINI